MVFDYIQNFRVLVTDVAFFSFSFFWVGIFFRFKTEEEAVTVANDTSAGLAGTCVVSHPKIQIAMDFLES